MKMLKLKSYHFAYFYIIMFGIISIWLFLNDSFDITNVFKYLFITILTVEILFYFYSFLNFRFKKWIKIGKFPYVFSGYVYIIVLFLIFFSLFEIFAFIKGNFSPDFSLLIIYYTLLVSLKQRNYNLIVKRSYLSIINNNNFFDYSVDEIKYIAIKNNQLAIALIKSDKVFNFPLSDFKKLDLEILNRFIKIENLEELK